MKPTTVDEYLVGVPEPKRSTLEEVRDRIRAIIPGAEECIAYNMPAYKVDGAYVAGFAAFANHLSYFPHSGAVLGAMADELTAYRWSKGALQFAVDKPLPKALIRRLIRVRRDQAGV